MRQQVSWSGLLLTVYTIAVIALPCALGIVKLGLTSLVSSRLLLHWTDGVHSDTKVARKVDDSLLHCIAACCNRSLPKVAGESHLTIRWPRQPHHKWTQPALVPTAVTSHVWDAGTCTHSTLRGT